MSSHNPNDKWIPIAFAVIFSSMFISIGFGGSIGNNINGKTIELENIKLQIAIAKAKERANNVESRLLSLEAYHRSGPAKAMGRAESKAQSIEDRGSDKGRGTAPKE